MAYTSTEAASSDEPGLSLVIPVRDEVDSLEALHREIDAALGGALLQFEVLFVDDGSRDGSLDVLRMLSSKDDRVRVISLDGSHGQSAALDAGFRAVRAPIVVTLDADLQNDPADIPLLLGYLEQADVVNGVRVARRDGAVRRLSSWVANSVRNAATGETVSDVGCSLRAMRTSYLRRVKLFRGMHRFLPTLLRLEGARITEVPVRHRPRRHGASKYGVRNRLFEGVVDLLAVSWMTHRTFRYQSRIVPVAQPVNDTPLAPGSRLRTDEAIADAHNEAGRDLSTASASPQGVEPRQPPVRLTR